MCRIIQNHLSVKTPNGWKTTAELKNIQYGDLKVIKDSLDKPANRQSKYTKAFVALCERYQLDPQPLLDQVMEKEEVTIKDPPPPAPIEHVRIQDLSPSMLDMTIACTVLAAQYEELECPPLVLVIGPTSTNKTGTMRKFRDPRLVKWAGRATAKSWLPGRPNAESERSKGIFERSHHRCIIQNELASMRGEDNMDFILGILTDSYGPEGIVLDDGGGEVIIPTYFTTIFGMTQDMYWEWIQKSLGLGQRFLVEKTFNDWEHYHSSFTRPPITEERNQWVNLLLRVKNTPLPTPTPEMLTVAYTHCQKIMILTSVKRTGNLQETNGAHRIADQIITMALMRSLIYERPPTTEDVKYFLHLTNEMIPYKYEWKQLIDQGIYERQDTVFNDHKQMFNNCFELKIFFRVENKWIINLEWYQFIKAIVSSDVLPQSIGEQDGTY